MRLLPRDEKFFDLFTSVAALSVEAAKLQLDLLKADQIRRPAIVDAIKRLEHEADQITLEVVTRLDQVFITPLDREDIHLLSTELRRVVDIVGGAARRAVSLRATERREPAVQLARILVRATEQIEQAIGHMKDSNFVLEQCRLIKECEAEGDVISERAISNLFDGHPNPIDVLRWKTIYDQLEDALDASEDVANELETLTVKPA